MSGPPEFPSLIAASVWRRSSRKMSCVSATRRPFAESTPCVTVCSNSPSGLPIATAPPETPPTITPARRKAAARAPLTSGLAARKARGFGRRARGSSTSACRRPDRLRLDHLADSRRAHLEIDVRVGLDVHVPAAGDLELLVEALEPLLGVGDGVDRLGRDRARWVDREGDVEVASFAMDGDLGDVAHVDRLAGGGLPRADSDDIGRAGLRQQAQVAGARELERNPLLAVVAQAVAHSRGQALVRDAHVLPNAEPRDGRERTRGRLEDQAHGARLALRGELVVIRVQDHWLGFPHAHAVLEERAPRRIVFEELRESALARAHGLVYRL